MIRGLDLGTEQGQDSRQIIDAELDWLDEMLADGRDYLVGDRFSRADLTAASLVSTLALPPEHPTYHRPANSARSRKRSRRMATTPINTLGARNVPPPSLVVHAIIVLVITLPLVL